MDARKAADDVLDIESEEYKLKMRKEARELRRLKEEEE